MNCINAIMFLPGFIEFSYENVNYEIRHSLVVTSYSIDNVVFTNNDGYCVSVIQRYNDMTFK